MAAVVAQLQPEPIDRRAESGKYLGVYVPDYRYVTLIEIRKSMLHPMASSFKQRLATIRHLWPSLPTVHDMRNIRTH